MNKIIVFLLAAIAMSSCEKQKNELNVSFSNPNLNGKTAYIYSDPLGTPVAIDSAVIASNKVSFVRANTDTATVQFFVVKSNKITLLFINENGKIEARLTDSTSTVGGTANNDLYENFLRKYDVIAKQLMKITGTTPADEALAKPILEKQSKLMVDFIRPNIHNKVGEFFLKTCLLYIDEADRTKLLDKASPSFKQEINAMMKPMETQKEDNKHFIDLTGNTPDKKVISLSDYVGKGKVVLVDFWASWCGPCRQEMPNVVAAYAKYKSKGFEIVGVSLDKDENAWKDAIKKLNITWPQMSDLKGWDSDLAATYNIRSIPSTLLIDKDGIIIGRDLRGEDLDNKLDEVLNSH